MTISLDYVESERESHVGGKKILFRNEGIALVYSFALSDEGDSRGKPHACVARYVHTTRLHVCARVHVCHLHRRRKQTSEVVEREGQKEYEVATAADRRRCARLRSCEGGRLREGRGGRGVERER